ncbi:alpha/beta hydrolase [Flammeovirga sp. MY04]|uniref:alpha/beta hydrolase n=1 Tax=Flammeovirga sp. MY04 TaxID=1191459 RepID=UPI0008063F02|nr:alpha/beta hydrolase [Flammeovirga sp. MY04]ANQ47771.1 alpha/beta hydrolase [Flammeovirga sp. MY04]
MFYFLVALLAYGESVLIRTNQGVSHIEEEKHNHSFDTTLLDSVTEENFSIPSDFGYNLSGSWLKVPENKFHLTMVMVHGVTHDRWRMMRYAQVYLKHGIDVVLYDHRKHGLSGGDEVSFGYFESKDLEKVIQWTKNKQQDHWIGAHGESLGAATVCMHSGINEETHSVNFYISDCAFSDTEDLLTLRAKEDMGLPDLGFVEATSLMARVRAGFFFSDSSPREKVAQSKVPFLFIHGISDTYIPKEMTEEMYAMKQHGEKFLWLVENAEHAKSISVAPKQYEQKVMEYIHTIISQINIHHHNN